MFSIGDKVEIVNYAHGMWVHKSMKKLIEDSTVRVISESDGVWFVDIKPDRVGMKATIINAEGGRYAIETEDGNKIAWFIEEQLKKIPIVHVS
jgi:hypothetical protein